MSLSEALKDRSSALRQRVWVTRLIAESRGIGVIAGLASLWQLYAYHAHSPFVPTLQRIAATAWQLIVDGDLWLHLSATLARVLAGLLCGTLAGLIAGTLFATSSIASRLVGPSNTFLRQVPIFGLVPLLSLWFGTQNEAKIILIAISAYFPVALQTEDGLRGAPKNLIEVAEVLRFRRLQIIRFVLLPAAATFIGTGIRQASAFAWISGVGVELFMNTGVGLGSLLTAARIDLRTDILVIAVSVVALVGFAMNAAFGGLERIARPRSRQ